MLYDGKTGAPLCVMDGSLITNVRTGVAGAISSQLLARKDSKVVAVFGSGGQARMQIYGLCTVLDIDRINVYSQNPAKLAKYKEDVERETGKKVKICSSPAEAMTVADIAISVTPSKEFLVSNELVKPGTHIVAVGADMAGKNEWDPEIFKNAKIVNDNIEQCTSRGETRNAIIAGTIKESEIYGEIGEIIAGKKAGRESDEEITIFDTTGMAIQDNVTAVMIYQRAKKNGCGSWFEFL